MKNNFNIITLLSEGHNFGFHGFWSTTDISENDISIRSEKSINGLYKVGDTVEVSLFQAEFPAIRIKCSFSYIDQSEFELSIMDFQSLKDRQIYNKLLRNRFYSSKNISSNRASELDKLRIDAH